VNLNSSVEGWNRLEPAQKWLDNHFNTAANEERARFQVHANEALYQEFLQWKRTRQAR
jgi:hypothetical protein